MRELGSNVRSMPYQKQAHDKRPEHSPPLVLRFYDDPRIPPCLAFTIELDRERIFSMRTWRGVPDVIGPEP
jgi:hypothetical protein